MIILDNVSKRYAKNEKFDSFTESIQNLFDELKEEKEGLMRIIIKEDENKIIYEKEENGACGILEEDLLTEELLNKVEEAINPIPVEEIKEEDIIETTIIEEQINNTEE